MLVLALVVVGIVVAVERLGGGGGPAADGRSADGLQVMQQDGSVVYGSAVGDAPVVEVYMDYQCPPCEQFFTTHESELDRMARDGDITLHYRPVSVFALRGAPMDGNSLRAGAAAMAAAEYGHFVEYQRLLFGGQPGTGEEGFSPGRLKAWGREAGISGPGFGDRVDEAAEAARTVADGGAAPEDGRVAMLMADLAAVQERYSGGDAFQGTPGVYVNGAIVTVDDGFGAAFDEALDGAGPGEVDTEPR